jgi:hypothetical protein
MSKQMKIAGMFLWNISIEYDGWTRIESKTLTITTRRKMLVDAQKKAAKHLKAFRYDYPKAPVVGIEYHGIIHE